MEKEKELKVLSINEALRKALNDRGQKVVIFENDVEKVQVIADGSKDKSEQFTFISHLSTTASIDELDLELNRQGFKFVKFVKIKDLEISF